jgi:hypothetical protein
MIVYTWKQYWNNFNNGDEWVFQDAERPRDDNMFKIRPWMQGDKWKWRETNKDTQPRLSVFSWVWTSAVSGTSDWQPLVLWGTSRFFSKKATTSDFSQYSSILSLRWGEKYIVELANSQMDQNKLFSYSNFRVTADGLIECMNTWTYLLGLSCQLRYASGHSTSPTYKEYAYMYGTDTTIANWIVLDSFSRRSTWNPWTVRWNYFSYIWKGTKLYFNMAHTDTSYNAMAYYTVTIVQIG